MDIEHRRLNSILCRFVSYRGKTSRFYFRGRDWREEIQVDGYINLKENTDVWRYSTLSLKDFDGYKITNLANNKVVEEVSWEN